MEEKFDVDNFISLVKTKESIWNYKSQVYGNKSQRRQDWMLICEAMIDDFGTKSDGEKCALAIELQAKWKVLRDGFARSVKNYKIKSGKDGSRSKLYTYYTQLQFLNDLYKDAFIISDAEASGCCTEEKRRKRPRKKGPETSSEDNENIFQSEKPLDNETSMEYDEDRQFLLSLLSDFKKISHEHKLDAKGDIINVIRHYKNSSSNPFQTRGSYFAHDIAALATTATDRPNSCGSSYFEPTETSRDDSPTNIKLYHS